jgi:fatty acid desaturase
MSREKRAPGTLLKGTSLNLVLFILLWAIGYGHLFALWAVAYFTVYLLIVRVRQMAEHAGVKDIYALEPKYNTRSLPRGIIGLLFLSPTEGLSYHCEHHPFMAVPTYHLEGLHEKLKANGYYDDIDIPNGYLSMFKDVVRV